MDDKKGEGDAPPAGDSSSRAAGRINGTEFAERAHQHDAVLVRAAWKFTRHRDDARELVQEVYEVIARTRRPDLQGEALLRYLHTCVRHAGSAYRSRLKERRRRESELEEEDWRKISSGDAQPDEYAFLQGYEQFVRTAIASLTVTQQNILNARLFDGKSNEEIARERGTCAKTIADQARTGLLQLRSIIDAGRIPP